MKRGKKTAEWVGSGLQCSVNGRLRTSSLLIKEAALSRCLIMIPVKQIYLPEDLSGPRTQAQWEFLPRNCTLCLFATLYVPSPVYGRKNEEGFLFNNNFWITSRISELSRNWSCWVRVRRVIKRREHFCLCDDLYHSSDLRPTGPERWL